MSPTLLIVRGIPGARKSTLARLLAAGWLYAATIVSEDDYWTAPDGSYHFDPATRPDAFAAMYAAALQAIADRTTLVVMATAALTLDDDGMQAVIREARQAGYKVFPLILQRDPAYRSEHGVTDAEMARFRREMEHALELNPLPR